MNQNTIKLLFALLRSAVSGAKLTDADKALYSEEQLPSLIKISQKHDIVHLIAFGLKKNLLVSNNDVEKYIFKAVYRYERLNYEYVRLCTALEDAEIPFVPLKGSVLCQYYPEPWMRTSCDIDILVHGEDLECAIDYLVQKLNYSEKERSTHDVSLLSTGGNCVELHFDLVEEGRANNAINILKSAWDNVFPHGNNIYRHDMTDAFFYFYHIAHMAKHFENGGCGIRPFIDLWLLDRMETDKSSRDELLSKGGLLKFAVATRKRSAIWFGEEKEDALSLQLQDFILQGGVYGTSENRVAVQQKKKGGRIGYIMSRIFVPYEKLKRYYPVLEKHRWLTPFMQVRRWFMLFNPDVVKMAKSEIAANSKVEKSKTDEMKKFLDDIGL